MTSEAHHSRPGKLSEDLLLAFAWTIAVLATLVTAGISLELVKHGLLVIQGLIHGLPYRVSFSVAAFVVLGVLSIAPATISRLAWTFLYRRSDPATVTAALLFHLLVLSAIWPALLATEMGNLLGR